MTALAHLPQVPASAAHRPTDNPAVAGPGSDTVRLVMYVVA
jgi:hypothetical protein